MLNLVLKDMLIQKKSLATSVLFAVIMILAFQSSHGNGAYAVGAIGIVFLLLSGAFAFDERNGGDILVNSLPVSRREVVAARYLSLLVFSLIALVLVSLIGAAVKILGIPLKISLIGIVDILGIYISLSVMFSIYIPIYFKFGYIKSRLVNMLLYIAVLIFSGAISAMGQVLRENQDDRLVQSILSLLQKVPNWLIGTILLLIIMGLLLMSMAVSMRVYTRREF